MTAEQLEVAERHVGTYTSQVLGYAKPNMRFVKVCVCECSARWSVAAPKTVAHCCTALMEPQNGPSSMLCCGN